MKLADLTFYCEACDATCKLDENLPCGGPDGWCPRHGAYHGAQVTKLHPVEDRYMRVPPCCVRR